MTIDFCKRWSDEEYRLFLDALRKRKTEYCENHGLPVPAFDKEEDFYIEEDRTLTIKDFKVGQSVFVMRDGKHERDKRGITEAKVVKVGRKYVTISGAWGTQFKEAVSSRPYLVEHVEYGTPRILFSSKEAADEYREREELKVWVRVAAGWDKIDRYTLGQLRAVKKILEETNNG